jgi:hypothetical protein
LLSFFPKTFRFLSKTAIGQRVARHRLPILCLAITVALFFWSVWLPISTPQSRWVIPQGGGDAMSYLWPNYRYNAAQLRQGQIPLWNPTLYGGAPYLADIQNGFWYPSNWWLALLPDVPYRAIEVWVAGHVFWAGLGMYALAWQLLKRQHRLLPLRVAQSGALFAGIAFQFSDVFLTHIGNLNTLAVSAYLPWLWLCLVQMQFSPNLKEAWRWGMALSGVVAFAVLAGHAPSLHTLAVAGGLYLLFVLWEGTHRWRTALLAGGFAMLGVASTALQLLPSLELIPYTPRAALDYAQATAYSLPWLGLAGWVSPLLYGRGILQFWASWERVELGFAGLTTLSLAILARPPRAWRWALWAVVGIATLLALGSNTPIYRWIYDYLPGFASFRTSARFVLLADGALCLLAAFGLVQIWQGIQRKQWIIWWGWCGLAVSLLGLGWWFASRALPAEKLLTSQNHLAWAVATALLTLILCGSFVYKRWYKAILVLLIVEMLGLGAWVEVDRANPAAGYPSDSPAVQFLRSQATPFRIEILPETQWQESAPQVFGLETVGGVFHPLRISDYQNYYGAVGNRSSTLHRLLNVKFVVSSKRLPMGDAQYIPVFVDDPQVDVYLNTQTLPRLHWVSTAQWVETPADALSALQSPSYDPTQQVILMQAERVGDIGETHPPTQLNLTLLVYQPEHQQVLIESDQAGYLVFSETWYPGWRATLNGNNVPVLRANYTFRAIPIPAGKSELTVRYQPLSWQIGKWLSLCSLVVWILMGMARKRLA